MASTTKALPGSSSTTAQDGPPSPRKLLLPALLPLNGNPLTPPPTEKCQDHFELGVALSLLYWPALSLAVQNNWGSGSSSTAIRDWLGGEIVSLFENDPETEMIDVETRLLNVMEDEFQVIVDDESAFEVAEQIMRLRKDCGRGKFDEVERLRERWERLGGKDLTVQVVEGGEQGDTDGSSSEEESEDEDGDVEMGEAPQPKEKVAPEVDEEGFTKVMGKKKR